MIRHLVIFSIFIGPFAEAQTKQIRNVGGNMNVSYGSASWNTDPKAIDSAHLMVRDKNTGKMVQILLEETEPDSAKFDGRFNVNLGEGQAIKPEVFIPPKEIRDTEKAYKQMYDMIKKNQLPRKPLIMKTNEKGESVIDVYDTREQAVSAYKAYQEQKRLEDENKKNELLKKAPDKQTQEVAKAAERKAALDKLALEAAKQEADRVRLEQIERQKALEREEAAKKISERERAERRAKAKILAEEALKLFQAGKPIEAEEKFRQSVELDPDNKETYFRYGVTLYTNGKFNEALVVMKLSEVPPDQAFEKNYFMGLTYYRLKELDNAVKEFKTASVSSDKTIGPSSSFYQGVVLYTQEKYEEAKGPFEKVIDTSSDPRMDQQAEEYLDRIAQALIFKKKQEKKFTVTGSIGTSYDSNVTLTADQSASGSATNAADVRLHTAAGLEYRAVYTPKNEFALKVDANLTNSSKSTVASSDPWIYDVSAPYTFKGTALSKGYRLNLKPDYQLIYMDPDSTGTKGKILSAYFLDIDNTFVMHANYFAQYVVTVRKDTFSLSSSTGDNNYDAMKYVAKTNQIFTLDKQKKESLTANFGYTINQAVGKNKYFDRIDFGASYSRPIGWGSSLSLGFAAYWLNYSKSDDKRKDFSNTLTVGFTKPIREWVTWSTTGSYSKNNSTVTSTYEYTRYIIMTTATFTGIF
ncbi:MAG: hypothetical protein AB7F86_12020 [Bdellovibrionales bacterium]